VTGRIPHALIGRIRRNQASRERGMDAAMEAWPSAIEAFHENMRIVQHGDEHLF
jgi:hypothetical protein